MRAVICRDLTGVGGLEYVDNWPEPQAGPGEVLVDVKAAALNFPDLLMIQGLYQERPPLPFVVGTEMSGVVSAVGPGVTHVAPGDRVVAACGRTLAERVVAKASLVIPAPKKLGYSKTAKGGENEKKDETDTGFHGWACFPAHRLCPCTGDNAGLGA